MFRIFGIILGVVIGNIIYEHTKPQQQKLFEHMKEITERVKQA